MLLVLIELHGLLVRLHRVREERALRGLLRGHLEDRPRADALVDVERDGVYLDALLLALPGPLQPGLLLAKGVGEHLGLGLRERPAASLGQQLGQRVGLPVLVEPQNRRQVRVVGVDLLGLLLYGAPASDPGRRVVLPLRFVVPVVGDVRGAGPQGLLGHRSLLPGSRFGRRRVSR